MSKIHYRVSLVRVACGQFSHVRNTDVRADVTCAQCKATQVYREIGPGWLAAEREQRLDRLRAAVFDAAMAWWRVSPDKAGCWECVRKVWDACAALDAAEKEEG